MRRALPALLVVVVSLPAFASTLEGHWRGPIRLADNGVSEAWVDVTFERAGEEWNAEIAIVAVTNPTRETEIAFDGTRLTILVKAPGNPTFHGMLDGDKLAGDFRHGGKTFPFILTREK
jgi:hypothetical protein